MHPFMDRWNHNTELYPTVAELIRGHELVLDVGCGDGTLVDYLNGLGHRAMGVDHDQSVLPTGEDANCHWADATNLPFVHDSFDAVVTVATLHHHRDPTLALGEMRRVLRPGGIIVVVGWRRTGRRPITPARPATRCAPRGWRAARPGGSRQWRSWIRRSPGRRRASRCSPSSRAARSSASAASATSPCCTATARTRTGAATPAAPARGGRCPDRSRSPRARRRGRTGAAPTPAGAPG